MAINKTHTKKLRKELFRNGTPSTKLYIGKSGGGWWYVGLEGLIIGGTGNLFITPDEAIQAVLDGFRPEEVVFVSPSALRNKE